ncbi:hypothetical protein [uncultured Thiodictyon sp.]|jgi:hypothetical protein|uniref:hypothetical protein n=1 Tax=uncultured Thiodictyon sp. TaxID=1846217 RepID=UPI0025D98FD8|nr:hypothetical protein [uncultured Thiodictyon sp.]
MNATLKRRLEHLERDQQERQGGTLVVLPQPGESSEDAIERTAAGWGRPVEAFSVVLVLDFCAPG